MATFGKTTYSVMCLHDHTFQMYFSQLESFYRRHVQCGITEATCEVGPRFFYAIRKLNKSSFQWYDWLITLFLHTTHINPLGKYIQ